MADAATSIPLRIRCGECGAGFLLEYKARTSGDLAPTTRTCPYCGFADPAILDTYVEQQLREPRFLEAPPRELHYAATRPYDGFQHPETKNERLRSPVESFSRNIDRLQ